MKSLKETSHREVLDRETKWGFFRKYSKLLEMNVRCEEAEALSQEAENAVLEMSVRCEEAEALRQEAENAVLEMSMRCEEAARTRSECEHVLRIGVEQEERIALLLEESARMQKERIESAADEFWPSNWPVP
jgi:hypothetical protein